MVQAVDVARADRVPIVYANDNRGVWDGDAARLVGRALEGKGATWCARSPRGPPTASS